MYEMIESIDQIFASIELSRSIFDALIGAVIGGFFTWLAAYYTMEKQRKLQEEQSWAEHMPLLRIEVRKMLPEACDFSVLGVLDGALLTSANPEPGTVYSFISVSPEVSAVFNFQAVEVYAGPYGVMKKSAAFAPMPSQLLQGEQEYILFNYLDKLNTNIDLVIRFEYQDVFGNTYVQDAAFQYLETAYGGRKRTVLERREVFQPQMGKNRYGKEHAVESLEKVVRRSCSNVIPF